MNLTEQANRDLHIHTMHVTACLAEQEVDVEVGEDCRTLLALKESIVKALPQLCVEGFDVSVGGRALDDDEGIVSLEESARLDVVANARVLSVLALREDGREVSEYGLFAAAEDGDVALVTLYLDAGVPLDCEDSQGHTPLVISCCNGQLDTAKLLLDRDSTAIDEKDNGGNTPLYLSCCSGQLEIARLLLDRGSTAIDEKDRHGNTPLHLSCRDGQLDIARLLLDRGSTAIDETDAAGNTPLHLSCRSGQLDIARLLLDRGCVFGTRVESRMKKGDKYSQPVLELLSQRSRDAQPRTDACLESAKRRRIGEQ